MKFALGEIATAADEPEALPEGYDALMYLQAIYRGKVRADPTRMRAANMALPYERPKLSVAVTTNHRGMGDQIDAARAKYQAKQSAIVAQREQAVASGERPVVSDATFRRIAEKAMSGDEATIGPAPKRKPG
jgi:hypothetical protein